MKPTSRRRGYALIAVLAALLIVALTAAAALQSVLMMNGMGLRRSRSLAAFHCAEAGLAKAKWELMRGRLDYSGESGWRFAGAIVDVSVRRLGERRFVVTSQATVTRGSGRRSACALRAVFVRSAAGRIRPAAWERLPLPPARPRGASASSSSTRAAAASSK